ncbi:hypothetical protein TNCT_416231 [Trichonephila clavata]|uniref:Par3/HAL N-terminal domain-containing protein n=1 Tax=Trichonephila clavata TaxID=2740835 RepID=A0A8X6G9B2_TRICU|nr:hypothetical protein TNCT_416231 [Trichonephila clavata]
MKVTVNFGSVRVIVPCGKGDLPVKKLMDLAITRYKKATGKLFKTGFRFTICQVNINVDARRLGQAYCQGHCEILRGNRKKPPGGLTAPLGITGIHPGMVIVPLELPSSRGWAGLDQIEGILRD